MKRPDLTNALVNAALLSYVGMQGVFWLMEPHQNNGTARHVLVGVQAVGGLGLAVWLFMRHHVQQRTAQRS